MQITSSDPDVPPDPGQAPSAPKGKGPASYRLGDRRGTFFAPLLLPLCTCMGCSWKLLGGSSLTWLGTTMQALTGGEQQATSHPRPSGDSDLPPTENMSDSPIARPRNPDPDRPNPRVRILPPSHCDPAETFWGQTFPRPFGLSVLGLPTPEIKLVPTDDDAVRFRE